jgi:very-short-patch-repair endonuclease
MTNEITAAEYQAMIQKKTNKKKSTGIDAKDKIEFTLRSLGINYVKEFVFTPDRKFRFDYAIPEMKIAIEYEGLFSEKSGHTTIEGYNKDCIKYNMAVLLGWKVLRYTAVNVGDILNDIQRITNNQNLNI